MINVDRLLRPCEVARELGVTPDWVRKLSDQGDLPAVRIAGLRFFKQEVVERVKREREAQRRQRRDTGR